MSKQAEQVAYLTRDCVIKPGKHGFKGDKIERDIVGGQVWEDLALAGALSKNPPETKSQSKKETKSK